MNQKFKVGLLVTVFTTLTISAQQKEEIKNTVDFSELEKIVFSQTKPLTHNIHMNTQNNWQKDLATYYNVYKDSKTNKIALVQAYSSRPDVFTTYFFEGNNLKKVKINKIGNQESLDFFMEENSKYSLQGDKSLLYMTIDHIYNQGLIAYEKLAK